MKKGQPLILALDTATPATSVAITKGTRQSGNVIASLNLSSGVTHSRRLLASVEYLLKEVGVDWEDLDGIGVSSGPGSFTGLRIGMATAKGLASAANKPLLGASTLDTLAARCVTAESVCAVLDARKKEVYAAFYKKDAGGLVWRSGEIAAYAPQDLAGLISEPTLLVGDGAVVYADVLVDALGGKISFAPAELHEPSAASLGMICCENLMQNNVLDLGSAVPLYVRSSDAELNLKKKQQAEKNQKNN